MVRCSALPRNLPPKLFCYEKLALTELGKIRGERERRECSKQNVEGQNCVVTA